MAWTLLVDVFKLPKDRLYVTYFGGLESAGLPPDHEARNLWLKKGISEDKVLPFGMKDNFWEMGDTGLLPLFFLFFSFLFCFLSSS